MFHPLLNFVEENPQSALIALVPLARTGKQRSLEHMEPYLAHELAVVRHACVLVLSTIAAPESLHILRGHVTRENDRAVRSTTQKAIRLMEIDLLVKRYHRERYGIPARKKRAQRLWLQVCAAFNVDSAP